MAENENETKPAEQSATEQAKPSRRGAKKAASSSGTRRDKVRGEYASGTGWEAGNVAPSTKYIDMDGKVSDREPKGGGHVLIAEGDVVREHMIAQLKRKSDDA